MTTTPHKTFGSSTAERTLKCPEWVALSTASGWKADAPDNPSEYAVRGTAMHKMVEELIEDGVDPQATEVDGVKITDGQIIDKVFPAADAWNDLNNIYDFWYTRFESYTELSPDTGGTPDVIASSTAQSTVAIIDFKFGDGGDVPAADNSQNYFNMWLQLATAKIGVHDYEYFQSVIIQPSWRSSSTLKVAKPVHMSDVIRWGAEFESQQGQARARALAMLKSGDLPFTTPDRIGEHCTYCPALANCPAHETALAAVADLVIEDPTNKLANMFQHSKVHKKHITVLEDEVKRRVIAGSEVTGFKVVNAKAGRDKWTDPEAVAKVLAEHDWPELVAEVPATPAQIRKRIQADDPIHKELSNFIEKAVPSQIVVPVTDKRNPAIL